MSKKKTQIETNKKPQKGRKSRASGRAAATKKKRLTKPKEQTVEQRQIPKEKLQRALDIRNDTKYEFLEDSPYACAPSIHYFDRDSATHINQLRVARTCLLRRDWCGLAKLLLHFDARSHGSNNVLLFGLVVKYAAILFAYIDKTSLELLLQSLDSAQSVDEVIKRMTTLLAFQNKEQENPPPSVQKPTARTRSKGKSKLKEDVTATSKKRLND